MPKEVVVPKDRPLTEEEYEKLTSHLRYSVTWYAMNGKGNTGQIEEKLREKKVPQEPVLVSSDIDGEREVNLWEETLEFLEDMALVDNETYAERLVEREVAKGRGRRQIQGRLWQKKVDPELANRLLDEMFSEEGDMNLRQEGLAKALRAAESSSGYRKAMKAIEQGERPRMSPRQAIVQHMVGKGFGFSEINEYLDEIEWV